jgi:hypothetical protein
VKTFEAKVDQLTKENFTTNEKLMWVAKNTPEHNTDPRQKRSPPADHRLIFKRLFAISPNALARSLFDFAIN